MLACMVLFVRVGGRIPLAVAATVSMFWFTVSVQLVMSADALTSLAQRVVVDNEAVQSLGVHAGAYPGVGLRVLAVAGAAGFCWALWMGTQMHGRGDQPRAAVPVGAVAAPSVAAPADPSTSPSPGYTSLGGDEW
jgi:hypothetical protein